MIFAKRAFLIVLAYFVACGAVAVVLVGGGLLIPRLSWLGLPVSSVLWLVGLAALLTAVGALLPAIVAISYAESFRVQSLKYYALCGGSAGLLAIMFFVPGMFGVRTYLDAESLLMFAVIATAGLAGGFVYWILAGRDAGEWKTKSAVAASPKHLLEI